MISTYLAPYSKDDKADLIINTLTVILVYVDMGNVATDTTTLAFTFATTTTTRNWDIKVTQVECSNPGRCDLFTFRNTVTSTALRHSNKLQSGFLSTLLTENYK